MTSGLRRFVARSPVEFAQRKAAAQDERCELCGTGIAAEHPHVVNLERRSLLCACRPCALLFTREGAGRGNYRTVPDRYLSDPRSALSEAQWDALQVPVGVAFFFVNSVLGRVVALYPGPAGATESLLDLGAWDGVTVANPLAAALQPDVEALIVRRDRRHDEAYLVPIDVCYELVGRLRMHWSGFDGGPEARTDLESFFARVREQARPLERADA
jgi:hypothetical protein